MAGAVAFTTGSSQSNRLLFYSHFPFQRTFFPLLQITDHTKPGGMFGLLEIKHIIVRLNRFQTKDFNESAGFFTEVQACLYHFCIIEYHQTSRREIGWK